MNYRRQQDFRSSLDKQREEVENRRVADQLVKQAEAQKLAADAQQYKMEQDRQMREHEKKIVRIKREREEQMADLRRSGKLASSKTALQGAVTEAENIMKSVNVTSYSKQPAQLCAMEPG